MNPSGDSLNPASLEYAVKKQAIVRDFKNHLNNPSENTFSLKKKTSNLFRNRNKHSSRKLDVKELNRVISIDPVNLIAEVEAMITYEDLVNETLKYNCLPPVIPELKTITIGGALVGLGIESSSFRYGLVHETILEIEILTGDGNVILCRPDNEHQDLFYAFPNSYGTLGIALKIKLKLIPAKRFVKVTNIRFNDVDAYFEKISELCAKHRSFESDTYVDGVIFDKDEMYIILGEFVDEAPHLSNYSYMSVYYQSIRKKETHYLTTLDYVWRWDADWFWCSKHFGMNQKVLRFLFGKFMLKSSVYWKIKHLISANPAIKFLYGLFEKPSESVIQDILIPIHKAPDFFEFFQKSIGIKPIWICPFQYYKLGKRFTLCKLEPTKLYIDFGFWDIVPTDKPKGFLNRLIEKKTQELEGFKSLYSESYYSKEEFWLIYPENTFSELKKKYDPSKAFKGLYEKCVR